MSTAKTKTDAAASNKIQRRAFVAEVLASRGQSLVVTGLGSPTWDVSAAGDRPDNLYLWGGMGLSVSTALGTALAQPDRRVVCITGDGELMMGIGSLAVVGDQAPKNLAILVLDNEHFAETGKQHGLSGNRVDVCAVARGFGISEMMLVTEHSQIGELTKFIFERPGPVLAVTKIALSEDPWSLPEKDGGTIVRRFRATIGV